MSVHPLDNNLHEGRNLLSFIHYCVLALTECQAQSRHTGNVNEKNEWMNCSFLSSLLVFIRCFLASPQIWWCREFSENRVCIFSSESPARSESPRLRGGFWIGKAPLNIGLEDFLSYPSFYIDDSYSYSYTYTYIYIYRYRLNARNWLMWLYRLVRQVWNWQSRLSGRAVGTSSMNWICSPQVEFLLRSHFSSVFKFFQLIESGRPRWSRIIFLT